MTRLTISFVWKIILAIGLINVAIVIFYSVATLNFAIGTFYDDASQLELKVLESEKANLEEIDLYGLQSELSDLTNSFNVFQKFGQILDFQSRLIPLPIVSYEVFQISVVIDEMNDDIVRLEQTMNIALDFWERVNLLRSQLPSGIIFYDLENEALYFDDLAWDSNLLREHFLDVQTSNNEFSIVRTLLNTFEYRSKYVAKGVEINGLISSVNRFIAQGLRAYKSSGDILHDMGYIHNSYSNSNNITNLKERLKSLDYNVGVMTEELEFLSGQPIFETRFSHDLNIVEAILQVVISAIRFGNHFEYTWNQTEYGLVNKERVKNNGYQTTSVPLVIRDKSNIEISINDLQKNVLRLSEIFDSYEGDLIPTRTLSDLDLSGWMKVAYMATALLVDLSTRDGDTDYLLLGHSSDELRASGGYVSAIWTLKINDYNLDEIKYIDILRVDNSEKLSKYPQPPTALREHMGAWVWLMRDVSWDPDYENVATNALKMFEIGTDKSLDGVVATNQWGLHSIVKSFYDRDGQIDTSTETLSSLDLITSIEKGTDSHGRAYLDDILKSLMQDISNMDSLSDIRYFLIGVKDAVNQRDLQVFFNDQTSKNILRDGGVSGSIVDTVYDFEGDYIYVVDSNVGWSKSDRNIEREMSYTVNLYDINDIKGEINLVYRNHSGASAASCHPQWIHRGDTYEQLKNSCHWNLIRVFIPQGHEVTHWSEKPLPPLSMSAVKGSGVPGLDTTSIIKEEVVEFSALDVLPFGERSELHFGYDLHSKVLNKIDDNTYRYKLLLQKQPGVQQKRINLEILIPKASSVIDTSHNIISKNGSLDLTLDLRKDVEIFIDFEIN